MKSSGTSPALLALTLFAMLALGANLAFSYKIYALSNTLDVFSKGNWTNATPPFTRYYSGPQISPDRTGSVLHALVGSGCNYSCPIFFTITRFNITAGGPIHDPHGGVGWRGRFAFDKANNIYSSGRYDPTGPLRSPIGRNKQDSDNIGWVASSQRNIDVTSFRGGNAMVFAGTFDTIYKTNNASNPDGIQANKVALYDTRKNTWSAMGSGIPFPVYRVVSNKDGTILVALTLSPLALWRWNGTALNWKRFDLDLDPDSATIYDIAFGANKLFLLGNFDAINGVSADRICVIQFKAGGIMTISPVGTGLPEGFFQALWVHSDTQIFIGGAIGQLKAVYEWRSKRTVPWSKLGPLGLTEPHGPPSGPGPDPVYSLTVF